MFEVTRSCKESVPYLPCKIIRRKHGGERVRAASKPFPAQTEAFEFGWTATPLTLNGASVLFNNAADGTNANQCYCLTPAAPVTWTAEACGSPCSATGPTAGKYVTISASYSFRPIIWTSYLQPGLLTDAVLIRVQ